MLIVMTNEAVVSEVLRQSLKYMNRHPEAFTRETVNAFRYAEMVNKENEYEPNNRNS